MCHKADMLARGMQGACQGHFCRRIFALLSQECFLPLNGFEFSFAFARLPGRDAIVTYGADGAHQEEYMQKPSFVPDFSKGLVPAIVQDAEDGEVLMLAYMDETAWMKTTETGEAHYWSRSRKKLWHKGESSGNVQKVHSIRIDCDLDTILLHVTQIGGAACHTGRRSCFYRKWDETGESICSPQIFDPEKVYKK